MDDTSYHKHDHWYCRLENFKHTKNELTLLLTRFDPSKHKHCNAHSFLIVNGAL